MRTLKFLLQKEFRQIFRNPTVLRLMFLAPIIQLLILPQAATYTIKNINIVVVDHDHSSYSQKLINKILSSGYFKLAGYTPSYNESYKLIEKDEADIVLEIPPKFEEKLISEGNQNVSIAVNAINGVKANVGNAYLNSIIIDFNNNIRAQWIQPGKVNPLPMIDLVSSNWYNPSLTYYIFMVPGILVLLLTLISGNNSALNIVREKEIGTIEQINVTPVKKIYFILGKLIPFWILGVIVFTIGLLIGRFVYGILPVGNIGVLYIFLSVYLLAILGFGFLISTYSETQQQAYSLMFFFVLIFNLMSGLFTPVESMPHWAQVATRFMPITYFVQVMRMVVLKGSGFVNIIYQLGVMLLMAIVFNTWAVLNYRKTS